MGTCCSRQTQSLDIPTAKNNDIIEIETQLFSEEYVQTMTKSALVIQAQFRGKQTRKNLTLKMKDYQPDPDIAEPIEKIPEILNPNVKRILEEEGPFDWDNCKQLPGARTLQPYQFKNGSIYKGQWIDHQRNGKGTQYWPDGSMYEGQWLNDKANGYGRLIHADGDIYQGDWKNDMSHGFGVYHHSDGSQYEGNWFEDEKHGVGKEIWADSAQYEGDYVMGKKEGHGLYSWNDGAFYQGEFKNNFINGYGEYNWPDGRQYKGYWLNNKMHGQGEFSWTDGKKYKVILKIKKRVMENLHGLMEEYIKDNG